VSLNAIAQEMAVIRNIFLISIPGLLLLVAGGAWGIAASSLHSIRRLTTVIGNVTASGLEQRVPIGTTDVEFVELIQVFNQMLERLERSFKQASRFSGDAATNSRLRWRFCKGNSNEPCNKLNLVHRCNKV
jgi:nitrogen fixation/metabolism regulation signal transduction histidine kinase